MGESSGKHRKIYIDHPKDRYKPTRLIHGPGNSSDECKVPGDFGSKHAISRPTKGHRNDPTNRKKFNTQEENNDIVNIAVDKIILQENRKSNCCKGSK